MVITPFTAAILGLGLNEGAYVAEIVRAGIISVGKGQTDAAQALGMHRGQVMRRIVLPQAVPITIPPLGNEFIGMLKYSALASVIARRRAARLGRADLLEQPEDARASRGRQHLVPRLHDRLLDRAALPRAVRRPQPRRDEAGGRRQPPPGARDVARPAMSVVGAERRARHPRGARAQALRPARGASWHRPRGGRGRGRLHHRPLRQRQVDLPALHQPPGADRRRAPHRRRRADGLPPEGRPHPRAARPRDRAPAGRDRDGLPELQSLLAHDRARAT